MTVRFSLPPSFLFSSSPCSLSYSLSCSPFSSASRQYTPTDRCGPAAHTELRITGYKNLPEVTVWTLCLQAESTAQSSASRRQESQWVDLSISEKSLKFKVFSQFKQCTLMQKKKKVQRRHWRSAIILEAQVNPFSAFWCTGNPWHCKGPYLKMFMSL